MRGKRLHHTVGTHGERIGEAYLVERGYQILSRNVRAPFGEIDLVARDGNALVFVEIKTRRGLAFGFPEEAVNEHKKRQLVRLASWYLAGSQASNQTIRFDVLSILFNDQKPLVRLFQNAFELEST